MSEPRVLLQWAGPRREFTGVPERTVFRIVEGDGARRIESALQEYPDQPLLSRPLIWEREPGGQEAADREMAKRLPKAAEVLG